MLVSLTLPDFVAMLPHLRAADRNEALALRWDDDLEAWAEELLDRTPEGLAFLARGDDGAPLYAWGYVPVHPGIWSTWGAGTERWPEIWRSVTKFVKGVAMPGLAMLDARYLQMLLIDEKRAAAENWLYWLGAREAARLAGYGRNGEDFTLYVWRPF